ncbi:MAG: AAA family ATPase [Bacteroidota bacterium]
MAKTPPCIPIISTRARSTAIIIHRAGKNFVFNATNLTREIRGRWIDLSLDYRARVELVYLEKPMKIVLEQNRDRERQVPETIIRRMFNRV